MHEKSWCHVFHLKTFAYVNKFKADATKSNKTINN
jgi:hypothetical protein